ncbi:hypothetical protein C8R44DRAFT_727374 [Mycena epipterygia]|nr:hypothetical protein C8R44DRAFT_727374 [Mycena epipterygia]
MRGVQFFVYLALALGLVAVAAPVDFSDALKERSVGQADRRETVDEASQRGPQGELGQFVVRRETVDAASQRGPQGELGQSVVRRETVDAASQRGTSGELVPSGRR